MQVTVDGFIGGPNDEMDWMVWNWDDELEKYVTKITEPVDCILLGKNLANGFIDTWASQAANPGNEDVWPINKMNDTPKIVFSKTLDKVGWKNTKLAKGDLVEEINSLNNQAGGDIIAYGGGTFVSSLIKAGLVDEFYLFVNPAAIGNGMSIFKELGKKQNLKLKESRGFDCGIVLLCYEPTSS